jgi:Polyketide cyclase / dehydrase and lipid transport
LTEGTSVQRTARFLGRSFTYGYLITKHEPDRLVEMTVQRPFPMLVRYELDDAPDGTLVAIRAQGTPGRFFGVATPVMNAQVRKRIAADLERLRRRLEP